MTSMRIKLKGSRDSNKITIYGKKDILRKLPLYFTVDISMSDFQPRAKANKIKES